MDRRDWRGPVDYCARGCKESDTTEQLTYPAVGTMVLIHAFVKERKMERNTQREGSHAVIEAEIGFTHL